MYLMGLDIGTSSTKGLLTNTNGKVIISAFRNHEVKHPQRGWAEQDAENTWWREILDIIKELLDKSKINPNQIMSIGVSGMCPVLVPVNKQGEPLRNAILYSIDSRAVKQVQELKEKIDYDCIIKKSGQGLSTNSVISKLIWLKENEPNIWRKTDKILGTSGYIVNRLCGEKTVDHFTAADGGLGYSIEDFEWDTEIFQLAEIDLNVMPRLSWSTEIVGYLSKTASLSTGLLQGTPIISGTGDALAEMISTGVSEVGETALLYGSTITTMTRINEKRSQEGFITTPGWNKNEIITSSVLGDGMSVFSYLRRLTNIESDRKLFDFFEKKASNVNIGSDGLLIFPYLTGIRSPFLNSSMRGTVLGLTQNHHAEHFFRAMMEAIGFALRMIIEQVPDIKIKPWRAIGGGVKSKLLLQIVSDICQQEQNILSENWGAPLGSAWLAGKGVNSIKERSCKNWVLVEKSVLPTNFNSRKYDKYYNNFKKNLIELNSYF